MWHASGKHALALCVLKSRLRQRTLVSIKSFTNFVFIVERVQWMQSRVQNQC